MIHILPRPSHRTHARTVWLIGAVIAVFSPAAWTQEPPQSPARTPVAQVSRTDQPPEIDGVLDDPAWADATVIGEFHQIEPEEYAPATEPMEIRVLFDDEHLYVAARLYDSAPEKISAKQLVQGRTYHSDDRFHVLIDPFHDRRNGYFFQLNANGIRRDALIEDNDTFINDWDAIWYGAAQVDERGWTAEMAIPFKSISFDPASGSWGLNFGRVVPRNGEQIAWSSRGNEVFELAPSIAGEMHGIQAPPRRLGLDIVPSATLRHFEDRSVGMRDFEIEPSLDIFYKPSPRFTLTGTLNTDFSATEVDDRQVNLTRFSLFFPEKRNFFLQDAGIFEFAELEANGRPFHSRRIGLDQSGRPLDLDGGLKATGRLGPFSFGALAVRQDDTAAIDAKELLVARGKWNILEESSVGFIATYGDPTADADNSLVGVDFHYRDDTGLFGRLTRGKLWYQQSNTDGAVGDEAAFGAAFELPGDRHEFRTAFSELQENFRPGLGFANRLDIREYESEYRFRSRPKQSRILRVDTTGAYSLVTDLDGRMQSRLSSIGLEGATRPNDGAGLRFDWAAERLDEPFEISDGVLIPVGRYDFGSGVLYFATGDQRPVSGKLELVAGDFYDGERYGARAELNLRPSSHYAFGFVWNQNEIDLPGGSFITRLAQVRADVAFNSRMAWLNFLQYDNVSDSAGINSRLRWELAPGRELFFIVNYNFLVEDDHSLTTRASEIALKLNYTFRP